MPSRMTSPSLSPSAAALSRAARRQLPQRCPEAVNVQELAEACQEDRRGISTKEPSARNAACEASEGNSLPHQCLRILLQAS
mmetsp:Transcript_21133/g.49606  ORF Transcript_21133/g.49606 Transcript_21133/m.49606 type:complete len:82 (+) Transcript_21133:123-368(+)